MFNPLDPDPNLIKIEDIAHALSMMCRANGHFKTFYSVGQHSINCMKEAEARGYSKRVQLAALIHDASEAYLSDITRPVKRQLPAYMDAEKVLQGLIYDKYLDKPLSDDEKEKVLDIDNAILYFEMLSIMDARIYDTEPELLSIPLTEFVGFEKCEKEFGELFNRLINDNDNE